MKLSIQVIPAVNRSFGGQRSFQKLVTYSLLFNSIDCTVEKPKHRPADFTQLAGRFLTYITINST